MLDILDEALLKLISLGIRFLQLVCSIVVVAGTAQSITKRSDMDLNIPRGYVATASMSGIAAFWSSIALLLTCCAGSILLSIETLMDMLSVGFSIAEAVLLSNDALDSPARYSQLYGLSRRTSPDASQRLVRACFAFAIIQV